MTAATVPPPSWIPIGAPEIRANTRRFFTRALAISGVGHLAVLGVVLWLQARVAETQPNWYKTAIHVIPVPPIDLPAPPVMPPTDRPTTHTNDHGTIKTVPWDPPTLDDPRRNVKAIGNDTTREPTSPAPPSSNETTIDNTPEEGAFVAFDQPPVPIYRPAPDYPGWAREQGIQARPGGPGRAGHADHGVARCLGPDGRRAGSNRPVALSPGPLRAEPRRRMGRDSNRVQALNAVVGGRSRALLDPISL